MTRRRTLRLSLIGVASLLVVGLLVGTVLGVATVRRPFPDRSGTVTLSGLDGPVQVYRDHRAVPQVYADTTDDLFRVQGYLHAQDRFFEMDLRRHITAGRLSELVGPSADALQADTVIRTMGWRSVAERELALLGPATRGYLEAYAGGVNDYLKSRSASQLSVSYSILGLSHSLPRIEPWTPVDSLAWLKAMAWDLKGNYDDELDRARMIASVKGGWLFISFARWRASSSVSDLSLMTATSRSMSARVIGDQRRDHARGVTSTACTLTHFFSVLVA